MAMLAGHRPDPAAAALPGSALAPPWAAVPITGSVDRERPVAIRSSGAFKGFHACLAQRWFEVLHLGSMEPAVTR